jgi:hypothetical protein
LTLSSREINNLGSEELAARAAATIRMRKTRRYAFMGGVISSI